MSDAESRILPWPGAGGPRPPPGSWGPWRPPAGAWPPGPLPPGPGPFPQPPDVFSAFAWLAKNYRESQAAKEFLKLLIQDMIAEDPTFLANAHATVGVTDGSAAQPGMVGELVRYEQILSYTAAGQVQTVVMGSLPPGDWDMWAFGYPSTPLNDFNFLLTPQFPGQRDTLGGMMANFGGVAENLYVTSPVVAARTAVPSLIAFQVATNNTGTPGPSDGQLGFVFQARRVR